MSEDELKQISKIINIDNFIVETKDGRVVSAAIIYHISKRLLESFIGEILKKVKIYTL